MSSCAFTPGRYVPNIRCRSLVQAKKPFYGSNLFAEWRDEKNGRVYTVYSYGYHFPMYVWTEHDQRWFANRDKYSVSTTRPQSLARPATAGTDMVWCDTRTLDTVRAMGSGAALVL
jgi:hypothetical protein